MVEEAEVAEYLRERYQLRTCPEWLSQCLHFVRESHAGRSLSVGAASEEVLLHYKDFDLSELEFPTLPTHVTTCAKAVIKGPVAVQVCAAADMSRPFYRQYQHMVGGYSRDCEVGEGGEGDPGAGWGTEVNGKRVMALQLSDGVRTVRGFEYKPIPQLSYRNVQPGCKLILLNKITCRKGILFLKPENVRVLGGSVESLVQTMNPLDLFARTLGKEAHLAAVRAKKNASSVQTYPPTQVTQVARESQMTQGTLVSDTRIEPINTTVQPEGPPSNSASTAQIRSSTTSITSPARSSVARSESHNPPARVSSVEREQSENPVPVDSLFDSSHLPNPTEGEVMDLAADDFESPLDPPEEDGVPQGSVPGPSVSPIHDFSQVNPITPRQLASDIRKTSTPYAPARLGNKNTLLNLGECLLSDLKTCQFGPESIRRSYSASVKCKVQTLLSPLEFDQSWKLQARVVDSSASLDTDFSSHLLEDLIGISPREVSHVRPGSADESRIKQALAEVTRTLKCPCLRLAIEYDLQRELPVVVGLETLPQTA